MRLGVKQVLTVVKIVDFGVYLGSDEERVLVHRACQASGNFAFPYTFAALPLHNVVGQFLLGHYLIFIRDTDSGHIIGKVRCVVPFKADMDTILIINMDYCNFRVNSRLDMVCNLLTDIP